MKKNITTILGFLMLLVPCTVMAQNNTNREVVKINIGYSGNDLYMTFTLGEDDNGYYAECGNALDTWASTSCIDESYTGQVFVPAYVEHNGHSYKVTSILTGAFENCAMSSLSLPYIQELNNHCIVNCYNLQTLTIPGSVTFIYPGALENNGSLSSLTVGEHSLNYSSKDNVLFNYDQTELIYSPEGRQVEDYTIPNTVTKIDNGAFSGNFMLKNVTIPSTITEIPSYAFYDCAFLTNVSFPNSITMIGEGAFSKCYQLSKIDLPNSLTYIGSSAFEFCSSLSSLTIPSSVKSIGQGAFASCDKITSLTLPNTLTEITYRVFDGCSGLSKFEVPAFIKKLGEAFTGGNVEIDVDAANPIYKSVDGVVYTQSNDSIIRYPTANKATSYTIANGTKVIFDGTFENAYNLTSVTIPNTVTKIGSDAFSGCYNINVLDIPESVEYIGSYAFRSGFKKIYLRPLVPPATGYGNLFSSTQTQICVPYQSLAKYKKIRAYNSIELWQFIARHHYELYYVATFLTGIDFSQVKGANAYKVVKNDGTTSGAKVNGAPIALAANGNVSPLKLVQVDKVAAGECVLIKFTTDTISDIELVSDTTTAMQTDNLLKGVTDTTTVGGKEGTGTNYVFDGENFVQVTGTTDVATGLGYLQLPEDIQQAVSGSTITITDLPATGINDIRSGSGNGNQTIYNLQGQRVDNPTHGVYIVNGRKVIIK